MLKKISDIFTSISNMAAGKWAPTKKAGISYIHGLFGF